MIASLTGTVERISLDSAVISVAGIGYKVFTTPETLATLRMGHTSSLLTELVVREDSLTLYGFGDDAQRDLFLLLQKVSGIGPRMALSIVSILSPADLSTAISQGDTASLQKVPGVGKRVAERLILELKEKVSELDIEVPPAAHSSLPSSVTAEVTEALMGLGFSERESGRVLSELATEHSDIDASALLRLALTHLGSQR